MVQEQFPIFRLATLLARQLSAPVAARIKEYAKRHPRFGRSVCMRVAQSHRALELRFKLWVLQARQPRRLPPLSDAHALDTGADILGEMIIFGSMASIITYEVNRKAMAQEDKEAADESRVASLRLQTEELRQEVALQQAHLDRLRAALSLSRAPAP